MKKRFLTVPLNDMGKKEYGCGIEKSDNLFITELPEKEFLILLEKFDEINNRCKILIDDYESEEISDNNLFDAKLIIDDIKLYLDWIFKSNFHTFHISIMLYCY